MRFEVHAQFENDVDRYWKAQDVRFGDSYWTLDIDDDTVVNISDRHLLCIKIRDLENHPKEDVMIDEHKAIRDFEQALRQRLDQDVPNP